MTGVAVFCGMLVWSIESGAGIFCSILVFLLAGLYFVAARPWWYFEVLVATFSAFLVLLTWLSPAVMSGDGERPFTLRITVVDAETGDGISGAGVTVVSCIVKTSSGKTAKDGTANVTADFPVSTFETRYGYGKSIKQGHISLYGEIEVESPGYESVQIGLSECVEDAWWDLYKPLPEVCIEMQPTPASQEEGI